MVIGLTGGIGSGKSTVTGYLREKGFCVIDADEVSRAITAPGGSALPEIRRVFGSNVFLPDGSLDRRALAEIVFSDPARRRDLEQIMHAEIRRVILRGIKDSEARGEKLVFVDIPLLFETGMDKYMDRVWVVYVPEGVRLRRVMERDGADEKSVRARMASQMDEESKKARADEILDNSGSVEKLKDRIDALLKQYENEDR